MRNLNRLASILLTAIALAEPAAAQGFPGEFVYLRDIDPSIIQEVRYAGVNNFMGRPMKGYGAAECVVKRSVGLALKGVQQELAGQKLSLKMLDCYRPARAVADMVAWSQNGRETAAERRYNPAFSKQELFRLGYVATHSQHSTGAAVDLTLIPAAQRRWRNLLLAATGRQGFVNYSKEWWYFSLPGAGGEAYDFPIQPRRH
jgi:D-alanyl-D-alanine dipeptidase